MADESLIAEEMEDLRSYLDGLPQGLRESEAFAAYRARLALLEEQWIAARATKLLTVFRGDLPPKAQVATWQSSGLALSAVAEQLMRVEKEYLHQARRNTRWASLANGVVALSSAGVPIGMLALGNNSAAAVFGIAAAATATLSLFLRFAERSRRAQTVGDEFRSARVEIETFAAATVEARRLLQREATEKALDRLELRLLEAGGRVAGG